MASSSIAIRESLDLYSWILTSHVVSMCAFAGLVLMMDLRLLGIGNMRTPFSQVHRALFPWQMVFMTCSAITGLLLVYTEPLRFYSNFLFWIKVVLDGRWPASMRWPFIAGPTSRSRSGTWIRCCRLAPGSRAPSGLTLWAAVVVSGRLIAYNWFTTP